ncbi:MAG: DUF1015 family protein [Chitinophagaceae bacterium]|jgi:uncharacterized protein (DUF1015 family)|nr:DUF1015 family protein [Chitinophagaceae bacterium]
MSNIKPFRALRPQPEYAAEVAARPYDVLNSEEARAETKNMPFSFLHITKSEIDLPPGTDIHSQEVYDKAKENLQNFIKNKILFQDEKPCYYIYELIMNNHSQTGLVAISAIDDYEKNSIKKHEYTRPEKEQDRINHIKISGAQTGNVFLAYRNEKEIDNLIGTWKKEHAPVYNFTANDGIAHIVWVVNNDDAIEKITSIFAEKIPFTYIADGHHRAASAAKVRAELGANVTEESNYFLTTLFPSNDLKIMDYNRVVKDLNGHSPEQFLTMLENDFILEKIGEEPVKPEKLHEFGIYLAGSWYKIIAKQDAYNNDPIGVLDVTILQNNILSKILGIEDPRTDKRIDFVGGIRGLKELEKRVDSGEMAVAFSLYPVSIEQLFDIADSGNVMPPKSTWFEPKLRDGLLTHLIY